MGIGDDIIATGMARGAAARGKRVAFGDGRRIIWGPHSKMVFDHNPNVAPPGSEGASDLEWVKYYKGHRQYNSQGDGRWLWNYKFSVKPGELFLTEKESDFDLPDNLVMIEPNVPNKSCAPNKQWPADRWRRLAEVLTELGFSVRQFGYNGGKNGVAPSITTSTFRRAAALLERSLLSILPEGGLHHAAAAVGTPAVVLFGGFVPPSVLGYEEHINLTGGASACGSFSRCEHCVEAMRKIEVDEVVAAAMRLVE